MSFRHFAMGAFGLAFLAAASTVAQEPRRATPPTNSPRGGMPKIDPKIADDPQAAAEAAAVLEAAYNGARPPEAVRMLIAILRGSEMGPGDGWFGPGESRYSFRWYVEHCGADPSKRGVPRGQFHGSDAWFARLDRNKDGVITPDDLDWSDRNPQVQMAYMVNRFFRRMNAQGNGRLTKEEMSQFFDKVAKGKDYLTSDDLRDALLGNPSGGFTPGDAPTPSILVRGLFAGEIGSMNEGPKLDQPAPNFTLKTVDGKESIQLSQLIGRKPVVLVFGNFTCGPFRSFYPDVDNVYQRFKDEANFLMVYVREAHPTDGWKMESNSRAGVAIKQPKTFEDRVGVASQFCSRLKPSMPVVVDEINDPVGNTYSGMPARLYVIDTQGKVAYKSGRGPFGFKAGEMEQALVGALLEQSTSSKPLTGAQR